MQNHTSCGCECTLSPSQCDPIWENWKPDLCQCRCKYGDKPPKPCGNGLVWSKNDCRCVCNKEPEICPPNKVWSLCNLRQRRLLSSYLRYRILTLFTGNVTRDDSQRRFLAEDRTALQHCCDIVSDGYNIVPTLQRCVALKSSLRIVSCNSPLCMLARKWYTSFVHRKRFLSTRFDVSDFYLRQGNGIE